LHCTRWQNRSGTMCTRRLISGIHAQGPRHKVPPCATLPTCAKKLRMVKKGRAVSRFLFLNLSFIFATYPPAKSGQPLNCRYIWSCRPVCDTLCMSPCIVVGSYPAFSPLPCGGCFLLSRAKDYSLLRFPQTGALSCADFPQRLEAPRQIALPF